jgi:hypothetical protein
MKLSNASAAVMLFAAVLAAAPVSAQQRKTVEGMVINIGIVNALAAEHVDSQHGVHQGGHGAGAEHIVVSLADAKSGARIAGAAVAIEVKDPKGKIQRKALTAMTTAGVPDYSEVFDFGSSGKYIMRLSVTPKGAAKPVTTRFSVKHYIP